MMTVDFFDMNAIYNEEYSYSLPRKVLEGFGKGLGFPDNTVEYTQEEIGALQFDAMEIWSRIQSRKLENSKKIILTAGAPGVGKTTLMRGMWENSESNLAYICPDDVCLKEMDRTYGAMVAQDSSPACLRSAYNKWRAASNFAHHLITAHLVKQHASFYFGTTASGDKTCLFLDFLKKNGYTIEILHVSAPDQVRFDSIAKRDKVFVQTSDQDVLNKQLMVHERIQDTFLKYADRIDFYFRDGVDNKALLAATWIRQGEGKGVLQVCDQKAYEEMKNLHDKVCEGMKKPELKWSNTVEKTL
jgi:predicted ABC-type ATPase